MALISQVISLDAFSFQCNWSSSNMALMYIYWIFTEIFLKISLAELSYGTHGYIWDFQCNFLKGLFGRALQPSALFVPTYDLFFNITWITWIAFDNFIVSFFSKVCLVELSSHQHCLSSQSTFVCPTIQEPLQRSLSRKYFFSF